MRLFRYLLTRLDAMLAILAAVLISWAALDFDPLVGRVVVGTWLLLFGSDRVWRLYGGS